MATGWIDVDEKTGGILIRPLKKGIHLQKNTEYFIGASSSPDHIIVTDFDKERIWYYHYPYTAESVIPRDIGEDLITQGSRTWFKTYEHFEDSNGPITELIKSIRLLLAGKPSPHVVRLHDFKKTRAKVKINERNFDPRIDYWRAAEHYGNVGGEIIPGTPRNSNDPRKMVYVIDLSYRSLTELKKDKRFVVL